MNRPIRIVFAGISLELYRETGNFCQDYAQSFALWQEKISGIASIAASGIAYNDNELREILHRVSPSEIDAVVISPLSYILSRTVWEAIKDYDAPICLWSTQTMQTITPEYVPQDLSRNHTVQGTQDVTNVLVRRKRFFQIVTGHYADPVKLEQLRLALETCRAYRQSATIKVCSLGGKFEGMDDFLFDPELVKKQLGWFFESLPEADYIRCWKEADAGEAEELTKQDFERCEIKPGLNAEDHKNSVRGYLALRKLAELYHFDAFTFNFQVFGSLPEPKAIPFYGINRMLADGYGYAGEGDALRAALMASMNNLASPVNFTEIYTVDFVRQRMLMTHMQECNPACARKDRKVQLRSMPFKRAETSYSGMYFTAEPGPVTLVTLTENGNGGLRYIVFSGEIEDAPPLKNYNRGHWILQTKDAAALLDAYSLAGGTHHLIAVPGDRRSQMKNLAQLQNVEYMDLGD